MPSDSIKKIVSVIAQFNDDGTIRPIRVRFQDEDGEYQEHTIKAYKDLSHQGARTMPDGMAIANPDHVYECYIDVFGQRKLIRLYFKAKNDDYIWIMTAT